MEGFLIMIRYIPSKILKKFMGWRGQLIILMLIDTILHMLFNVESASFMGYVIFTLPHLLAGFGLTFSFLRYGILGSAASHYVYNMMIVAVYYICSILRGG